MPARDALAPTWQKSCRCGSTWSARTWAELEWVGSVDFGDTTIELRQCTCGSTISIVPGGGDVDLSLTPPSGVTGRFPPIDDANVKPHVLLVDDDPLVRRALVRSLSGTWRTSEAETGEEMLTALAHGATFDALVIDVELPGIGMPAAFDALCEINSSLESRVVFITGGPASEETRRFLASVQNSWLRKPFPGTLLRDLLEVVRRG